MKIVMNLLSLFLSQKKLILFREMCNVLLRKMDVIIKPFQSAHYEVIVNTSFDVLQVLDWPLIRLLRIGTQ